MSFNLKKKKLEKYSGVAEILINWCKHSDFWVQNFAPLWGPTVNDAKSDTAAINYPWLGHNTHQVSSGSVTGHVSRLARA